MGKKTIGDNSTKNGAEAPTVEPKKKSPEQDGDERMKAAAIELKIHPGLITRTRETTLKVKLQALKKIDAEAAVEGVTAEQKAHFRKVKLYISTL